MSVHAEIYLSLDTVHLPREREIRVADAPLAAYHRALVGRDRVAPRDLWARVVAGEVSPRTAVEEVLRYDAPLQLFERWVLDPDVEIGGVALPVGARVAMLLGSANRDPRRFPDPERFDVGRGDAGHVAFGGGIHLYLGAPLARLEIETTLGLLAGALPRLELAQPPGRRGGFQFRGFESLVLAGG